MSRLIAPVCAAVVLVGASAHAAEKPKLVLVPFVAGEGATDAAAGRFLSLVREELKTRGDAVELVTPPSTKPAAAPAAEKPAAASKKAPSAEAVGALEAGRKAFDDLRFEDAVPSLRKGIEAMLQDPATADYEGVTDAMVKLAAAAFRLGEEKDAKAALLDLARFTAADFALPPGYPPVFQREFDKARKRLDKQPRGQVSIEGPAGSTAFFDGRDLGMVPVVEEGVPAGMHYVKVEGPKGERFGQVLEAKGTMVRVKASFGGSVERAPVVAKAAVADPSIAAIVDEATQGRLSAYAKAVNADYALVGYVYKTSDTQLTAGTALFAVKKGAFATLPAVTFDTDVLTANTEAFKVGDELTRRLTAFGASAALPLNLATRAAKAGTSTVAAADTPKNVDPEELDAATPTTKKVVLVPKDPPKVEQPPMAEVEPPPPDEPKPGEVKSSGVPTWVWVVTGVAVAAGAGVGGYFAVTEITKPVTGTVTATW